MHISKSSHAIDRFFRNPDFQLITDLISVSIMQDYTTTIIQSTKKLYYY